MRSSRDFAKGQDILNEAPVAILQSLENRAVFPSCAACATPLGTPGLQLAFAQNGAWRSPLENDVRRIWIARGTHAPIPELGGAGVRSGFVVHGFELYCNNDCHRTAMAAGGILLECSPPQPPSAGSDERASPNGGSGGGGDSAAAAAGSRNPTPPLRTRRQRFSFGGTR